MVVCIDCNKDLPGAYVLTKRCPDCRAALARARYSVYYAANSDMILAKAAAGRVNDPDKYRAAGRRAARKRTGVTNPTGEMKTGACYRAGCTYVGPLDFDHWHHGPKKGEFRGWLCRRCNLVAGNMEDSAEGLRALADYLDLAAGVGWPE